MRRFQKLSLLLALMIATVAPFFGMCWIRSIWRTDDVYFGRTSMVFSITGMTRFKSMGGGIWTEFRPARIRGPDTVWQTFPSTGQYRFVTGPSGGLGKKMGFVSGNKTFVFPCWFPALVCGSLGLGAIVLCGSGRAATREDLPDRADGAGVEAVPSGK